MVSAINQVRVDIIGNACIFGNGPEVFGRPHQPMVDHHSFISIEVMLDAMQSHPKPYYLASQHLYLLISLFINLFIFNDANHNFMIIAWLFYLLTIISQIYIMIDSSKNSQPHLASNLFSLSHLENNYNNHQTIQGKNVRNRVSSQTIHNSIGDKENIICQLQSKSFKIRSIARKQLNVQNAIQNVSKKNPIFQNFQIMRNRKIINEKVHQLTYEQTVAFQSKFTYEPNQKTKVLNLLKNGKRQSTESAKAVQQCITVESAKALALFKKFDSSAFNDLQNKLKVQYNDKYDPKHDSKAIDLIINFQVLIVKAKKYWRQKYGHQKIGQLTNKDIFDLLNHLKKLSEEKDSFIAQSRLIFLANEDNVKLAQETLSLSNLNYYCIVVLSKSQCSGMSWYNINKIKNIGSHLMIVGSIDSLESQLPLTNQTSNVAFIGVRDESSLAMIHKLFQTIGKIKIQSREYYQEKETCLNTEDQSEMLLNSIKDHIDDQHSQQQLTSYSKVGQDPCLFPKSFYLPLQFAQKMVVQTFQINTFRMYEELNIYRQSKLLRKLSKKSRSLSNQLICKNSHEGDYSIESKNRNNTHLKHQQSQSSQQSINKLDEIREKMIKYVKILQNEKREPQFQSKKVRKAEKQMQQLRNSNNQEDELAELLITNSARTPYQMVTELIKNNICNQKHIRNYTIKMEFLKGNQSKVTDIFCKDVVNKQTSNQLKCNLQMHTLLLREKERQF